MSENVIQMPVPSRPEWLACVCGSAWFNTAVTFDRAGDVTGYSVTHAVCRECGRPMPQPTDASSSHEFTPDDEGNCWVCGNAAHHSTDL